MFRKYKFDFSGVDLEETIRDFNPPSYPHEIELL
jgi:hypothetical protein